MKDLLIKIKHKLKGCLEEDMIYISDNQKQCSKCGKVFEYTAFRPDEMEIEIINACKRYEGDKIEGIKKVIGKYCGYDYTECKLDSVFFFIEDIFNEYTNEFYKNLYYKDNFFEELFKFKKEITLEDVIQRMICAIAMIRVRDNGRLLINLKIKEE